MSEKTLTALHKHLLNDFQRDFPLTPTPFADMARQLGVSENDVLTELDELRAEHFISRVGPVFAPHRIGVSTLAAMAVPQERLEAVAAQINAYPEVNHNYEREHRFNLWFVVTATDTQQLADVLNNMEQQTGLNILSLPLLQDYHIDLGFELNWRHAD